MTYVYIQIEQDNYLVGILNSIVENDCQRFSFEYAKEWLDKPFAFAIEPSLPLNRGIQFPKANLRFFPGISYSATDSWIRRMIRYKFKDITIPEIQYLRSIDDLNRFGALRFTDSLNGKYDSDYLTNIPPFYKYEDLINSDLAQIKNLIFPPESTSMFRPKAIIRYNDNEYVAKFSILDEEYKSILWETVAFILAQKSKIYVPSFFTTNILGNDVLLTKRFDRYEGNRIHAISGMALLCADETKRLSYVELADAIKAHCIEIDNTLIELWKRIVFNILISNFDDHLNNYSFLYKNYGWQMAPAYDLNPTCSINRARLLETNIDETNRMAQIDLALSVADNFNLSLSKAKQIAAEIASITKSWHIYAKEMQVSNNEIDIVSTAFEHIELKNALKLSS
jgi:serine/threonine-protein kinase HipA